HRFDGEEHARAKLGPRAGIAGVDDLGRVVEQPAQAMAAEIAHDAVAVRLGIALDRMGNVAEPRAGLHFRDAAHHRLIGHLDQLLRLDRYLADAIHAARVAVPAVDDRGHVDIDDIAFLERLGPRDAVADDMVDRGAAAL